MFGSFSSTRVETSHINCFSCHESAPTKISLQVSVDTYCEKVLFTKEEQMYLDLFHPVVNNQTLLRNKSTLICFVFRKHQKTLQQLAACVWGEQTFG